MRARIRVWLLSAGVAVAAPLCLGGCLGGTDASVARAEPVDLKAPVTSPDEPPPIRTVRRAGSTPQVADAADASPGVAGLPTPSDIFDFHPAGSKPGSWRQPFVIDPDDGPLTGYVRRMDAELKESDRQTKTASQAPTRRKVCPSSGPVGAISARCGENDVAKSLAR